MQEKATWRLF